jgi:hypothetical protein
MGRVRGLPVAEAEEDEEGEGGIRGGFAVGAFVGFPVGLLAVARAVGRGAALGAAFEGDGGRGGAAGVARVGHGGLFEGGKRSFLLLGINRCFYLSFLLFMEV